MYWEVYLENKCIGFGESDNYTEAVMDSDSFIKDDMADSVDNYGCVEHRFDEYTVEIYGNED